MKKMEIVVRISAVGDIMLGDHPVRLGHGVRSCIEKNGTDFLFTKMANCLGGSDIVFGNLEVTHSDQGLNREKIESTEFRGFPESIPVLKKAGFNVVNFANNHSMEHGAEAFWETVSILKRNNILIAGVKSDDGRCIPVEIVKKNNKVVLLSYSLRSENYYRKGDVPYALKEEESILEEVRYFIRSADILIVSLHWGEEFMDYPSPRQVLFAHKLVDEGARLIIGHHPHVLQGIEKYNGGVIAYSLGNFIFDMWQKETRKTIIMNADCSFREINIGIIPLYTNSYFQPEPLGGYAHEKFMKYFEELNRKIKQEYKDIDTWDNEKVKEKKRRYDKQARNETLIHRLGNYIYFLMHLYKYKPSIIMQSLHRSFTRRMEEIQKEIS